MYQIISFIRSSFKEINPLENIKILNTNVKGDILAGITVAIIALPLALAFGEISQLGPIAGVWGAIAGGIVGGLFGGCMVGVSGPTAPKAAQIATFMGVFVIGSTNNPDLVAAFSIIFLSGLILVAISMFKVSHFIHYTPYSVIAGFMCGIGMIVIITQINAFLGLEAEKDIHAVFKNFNYNIQNINIEALYVAIPSLLILIIWDSIEKKIRFLRHIPAPLVVLVIGSGIAYFLNLNIPYIGDKMGGADEARIFSFYIPDLNRLSEFMGPALALAGLAVLDSLLSCKVADNMTRTHHSSDRETFGQGMANMAAGLFGGVTTATATMRTVANIKFGGKTPLASIVHGLTLLAILLGLGPLVVAIPIACLAAILFKVGIDILDYRILPVLRKLPIGDLLVFIIVLFVTVYEDLMIAVAMGVLFIFLRSFKEIIDVVISKYQHNVIPLSESDFDIKENGFSAIILEPQGPLFFGSAESVLSTYGSAPEHDLLIIDMSNVNMIDLSGAYALEDFINNVRFNNIKVFVLNPNIHTEKVLKKLNFITNIGEDFYKSSKNSISSTIAKQYINK
tara:strand:- start:357 stop:2054 length:1698 start_codon:yes stop_codon:yes gene_type:complete